MISRKAQANANIALVKYWGKSDKTLNIPAVPSLSMTLADFGTITEVSFLNSPAHELFIENKANNGEAYKRYSAFLEQLRLLIKYKGFIRAQTYSKVPYKAGLASSASFYASLVKALNSLWELKASNKELSRLARMGSASAARSIFGGFCALNGGHLTHEDAYAWQISSSLDLSMLVFIVQRQEKSISSRSAMINTAQESCYYPAFVKSSAQDFKKAKEALANNSFELLGKVMEHSTLKMHASMWAIPSPINYITSNSLALIERVYLLREKYGPLAFFTMDAGPNVKVLTKTEHAPFVKAFMSKVPFPHEAILLRAGTGAQILDECIS